MVEGTRHERVVLIVLAYVIGFITAFIAYNFTPQTDINTQSSLHVSEKETGQTPQFAFNVVFEDDGLYAVTNTYRRIISANKNVLSAAAQANIAEGSGYHYKIVDAEASRNGKYIYYCEQLSESSSTCDPYVYNLETDTVHHVTDEGRHLTFPINDHQSQWLEGSILVVNNEASADFQKPWVLERWLP